jgi:hypothetical protein
VTTTSGINNLRCIFLAAGVGASGAAVNEPLSCLVSWRSEHEDKFYQVYVNGRPAGVTVNIKQRKMVVPLRLLKGRANKIEVVAVDAAQKNIDLSPQLKAVMAGRLKVSMPRSMSLPYEGRMEVYSNGGAGQVDYQQPITREPIQLWANREDKGGFGLSRFGKSDFGYDGSASAGFGLGDFGIGEYGFDSNAANWESEELSTGVYKLGVEVTDYKGNSEIVSSETETVIIEEAMPAEKLTVGSYDKSQNELLLSIG